MTDQLWKTADAANYANIKPATLTGWIRRKKCTCFKRFGGSRSEYRVNPNSFKAWLDLKKKVA